MVFYDDERKTFKKKCVCGEELEIEVRADVEITSYLTIEER